MPREVLLYLEDMLAGAHKIKRYSRGVTFTEFSANDLLLDATLHNLKIIGEAAKNVLSDIRARHPEVDWRGMARLRDVLAHHYFGIDLETIWDIVMQEIPLLLTQLTKVIEGERGTP